MLINLRWFNSSSYLVNPIKPVNREHAEVKDEENLLGHLRHF